jgi:hypothetical protein
LESTKKILGILERQQKTGGIPIEEVSKAKLALDEAQAEWDALKPKDETPPEPKAEPERPTPPATPTATPP